MTKKRLSKKSHEMVITWKTKIDEDQVWIQGKRKTTVKLYRKIILEEEIDRNRIV